MNVRFRLARLLAVVALAALVAGCTSSGSRPSPSSSPASPSPSPSPHGARVSVLGLWSGPEYDSFVAVKSVWERATGSRVDWVATQDAAAELDARIAAGHPPDIAVLPNLRVMQELAAKGRLVRLDTVLDMRRVRHDYAPAWLDLGSYRQALYAIFYKVTSKSTFWYGPKAFAAAGYRVPTSWAGLGALADRMVRDRRTPFAVVAAQGPATGWPLTDWVANLVLTGCGPDVYDRWVAGALAWDSGCVRQSFARFTALLRTRGYVLGGSEQVLATTDADGADPLYTDPPTAYLCFLASFAQAFIAARYPDLRPGPDYAAFPFPAVDARWTGATTVGADVVVMLHDTPVARSFLRYLAGAAAQQAWIARGGFTSVNRSVPLSAYRDPVARALAGQLAGAKVVRFAAGDLMPAALQRAWWAAMLELVQHPASLDALLARLSALARRPP